MQFRKTISLLVLVALMMWTLSALCAPLPTISGPAAAKVFYRTMVVQHPAMHNCCAPQEVVVVICYRMHGDEQNDSLRRCLPDAQDDSLCGTAKYHDDGQARACAMAGASYLLSGNTLSAALWESAELQSPRSILEAKSDLRI